MYSDKNTVKPTRPEPAVVVDRLGFADFGYELVLGLVQKLTNVSFIHLSKLRRRERTILSRQLDIVSVLAEDLLGNKLETIRNGFLCDATQQIYDEYKLDPKLLKSKVTCLFSDLLVSNTSWYSLSAVFILVRKLVMWIQEETSNREQLLKAVIQGAYSTFLVNERFLTNRFNSWNCFEEKFNHVL